MNLEEYKKNYKELKTLETQLDINLEMACRRSKKCIGCDKEKETPDSILCWDCFKNRKDAFKYSVFGLTRWLKEIGRI